MGDKGFPLNTKQAVLALWLLSTLFGAAGAEPGGRRYQTQDRFRVPEINIPGSEEMVDVGGRRLHSFVYGQGAPTVVLASGFNAPQVYWNAVVPSLAERATVVTYDRAGYGKSEIGDLPCHGIQSARDMDVLLTELGVPGPYILIGHSYGARVVRLYASLYPDKTAGLILMDGQHPDILEAQ